MSARRPPGSVHHPDEIAVHINALHNRFLSLQAASTRRVGPAMAFFEPFLQASPTLSFVRCTVCVPGPLSRTIADSIKADLSKPLRSDGGAAINKGKVPRIRGFVARSSRTAGGGTSSLFNHAHRSHPALLSALRQLLDRDMPPPPKSRARTPSTSPTTAAPTVPTVPQSSTPPQPGSTSFPAQSLAHPIRSVHASVEPSQNDHATDGPINVSHPHTATSVTNSDPHVSSAPADLSQLRPCPPISNVHPRPSTTSPLRPVKRRRKSLRVTTGAAPIDDRAQPQQPCTTPSKTIIRLAAALASGLFPPGTVTAPCFRVLMGHLSAPLTRNYLLTVAWPLLRDRIKPTITERLTPVPAISVSLDEWVVAGKESRFWAVNVHAVDSSWTRFVANLGLVSQLPCVPGVVVDPRPVLDAYGVRGRIFAAVVGRSKDVALMLDDRLNDVVDDCFRGRCLFSAVADAVQFVCTGQVPAFSDTKYMSEGCDLNKFVVRGEKDVTVKSNAAQVAQCITTIRRNASYSNVSCHHVDTASAGTSGDGADAGLQVEAALTSVNPRQNHESSPRGPAGDIHMDSDSMNSAAAAVAITTGASMIQNIPGTNGGDAVERTEKATNVGVSGDGKIVNSIRLPKPWLKGNFMSMAREWELVCAIGDSELGFSGELVQLVRNNLSSEHWIMTKAVVKVLQLVRRHVACRDRWCLLPDALMKMINLVCGVCDRLTEIELLMEQSNMGGSNYGSMRESMAEYVRSRIVRDDTEDLSMMVAAVEGCLLNRLLEELYPLVRPFVEYMPKESYFLMALALDPRYGSLASLISLNKKLMQGNRLIFEKELYNEDSEGCDDRVRKLVLSMLARYDNETMIPMMVSLNSKVGNGCSEMEENKGGQDNAEEGLFAETFEPTEDWKSRQQLEGELSKFRSFKKNIARTASGAESLRWWESNAELFPNIAMLFRKVVSVPSSHVPVRRILSNEGAKMKVARHRLSANGLEDVVYIHENLDAEMFGTVVGDRDVDGEWQMNGGDVGLDDEELYELSSELFSS